jgi:hypothetical protein
VKRLTNNSRKTITRVATVVIIILATMIATYSLFLLTIGQPWSVVYEDNIGNQVEYVRAPQAIVPLLSTVMILGGLIVKQRVIAWIGTVILLLFSLLFVFGVGGIFLPVAGAMLLLIAIISVVDPVR